MRCKYPGLQDTQEEIIFSIRVFLLFLSKSEHPFAAGNKGRVL